eukprot:8522452-Pyramimonas_sp.AAC.1
MTFRKSGAQQPAAKCIGVASSGLKCFCSKYGSPSPRRPQGKCNEAQSSTPKFLPPSDPEENTKYPAEHLSPDGFRASWTPNNVAMLLSELHPENLARRFGASCSRGLRIPARLDVESGKP